MSYRENIAGMIDSQIKKGLETYGCTLEDNRALNVDARIKHLQEELVDSLFYTEHIKALWNEKVKDAREEGLNEGYLTMADELIHYLQDRIDFVDHQFIKDELQRVIGHIMDLVD